MEHLNQGVNYGHASISRGWPRACIETKEFVLDIMIPQHTKVEKWRNRAVMMMVVMVIRMVIVVVVMVGVTVVVFTLFAKLEYFKLSNTNIILCSNFIATAQRTSKRCKTIFLSGLFRAMILIDVQFFNLQH